jgi:hypothetical protein
MVSGSVFLVLAAQPFYLPELRTLGSPRAGEQAKKVMG